MLVTNDNDSTYAHSGCIATKTIEAMEYYHVVYYYYQRYFSDLYEPLTTLCFLQ
jgi:hypothetical protein